MDRSIMLDLHRKYSYPCNTLHSKMG